MSGSWAGWAPDTYLLPPPSVVDQKQPGGDASQLRALAQPLLEVKFTSEASEAKQERPHGHFSGV